MFSIIAFLFAATIAMPQFHMKGADMKGAFGFGDMKGYYGDMKGYFGDMKGGFGDMKGGMIGFGGIVGGGLLRGFLRGL
jgi:hypothetical protein